MGVSPVCMSVHQAPGALGSQKSFGSPGIGVTDYCEPPCGCWGLNPGPLQMLLITKPSLQTRHFDSSLSLATITEAQFFPL